MSLNILSWNRVTWASAQHSACVDALEHPVLNCIIPKITFQQEFGPVLNELDGASLSDFVDFYFRRDAVTHTTLRFIGEDERHDFLEWAIDLKCCPPLNFIRSGDDWSSTKEFNHETSISEQDMETQLAEERRKVMEKDKIKEKIKEKIKKKRQLNKRPIQKNKIIIGRRKGIETLKTKILKETNKIKLEHLQKKLEKARHAYFMLVD